jgi:hypothetical protein
VILSSATPAPPRETKSALAKIHCSNPFSNRDNERLRLRARWSCDNLNNRHPRGGGDPVWTASPTSFPLATASLQRCAGMTATWPQISLRPRAIVLKQGATIRQVSPEDSGGNLAPSQKFACFCRRNLAPSRDQGGSKDGMLTEPVTVVNGNCLTGTSRGAACGLRGAGVWCISGSTIWRQAGRFGEKLENSGSYGWQLPKRSRSGSGRLFVS